MHTAPSQVVLEAFHLCMLNTDTELPLLQADLCYFLLGWVEAPGSSQGSGRSPQSTKQGLLCCQEEAAGPQDKGNCQCRTGVSLWSCLYYVSWTVQHVPMMNSVKALPFNFLFAFAKPTSFLLNHLHSRMLFTPVCSTERPGGTCHFYQHRLCCADRYACGHCCQHTSISDQVEQRMSSHALEMSYRNTLNKQLKCTPRCTSYTEAWKQKHRYASWPVLVPAGQLAPWLEYVWMHAI